MSDFEKIEVRLKPPYSMNNYIDPIFRGRECGVFQGLTNFFVDKGSLTVRSGLTRQNANALESSKSVLALHRTNYLSGTSQMYASIAAKLKYYTGAAWSDMSLPTDITLTDDVRGEFRNFKNKTYYTNHEEPILMIREGSPPTVTKAGLPDPNAKKDIQLCEDKDEWSYHAGGGGGAKADDLGMNHYTQGDQGVSFSQTTSGETATLIDAFDTLDLTAFEDGSTSNDEDFIAFTAFRFTKQAIAQLKIELSTGGTNFANSFSCNVYNEPLAGWDYWSPRQTSMSARWANDPANHRLFDVKLRKKWFDDSTGSPDWSDVRAIRFSLKGDNNATADDPAKVVLDNIRLLKTPPVVAPYELQIAEFERQESWSGDFDWVDYWATKGVSCAKLAAGETMTWSGLSLDLSEYADGVSVDDTDTIQIDVGGPGSSTAYITLTLIDSTAKTSVFIFGILSMLTGGGVTRQLPRSGMTISSGFDWSDIASITIRNDLADYVYLDNLRIGPARPQMWIDPFIPVDRIAIDALGEWLDPWLRDHPLVAAIAGYASEFYEQFWYTTSGEGTITYPDWSHGQLGACSMRLQASGGSTFNVLIKRKQNLDLTEYRIWVANNTFVTPSFANWEAGYFGWLKLVEIDVRDSDEFQIWLASPNWAAVREIKFKFFYNEKAGAAPPEDLPALITDPPTISMENYWEYTMNYSQIQEKVIKLAATNKLRKQYEKIKNSDAAKDIYLRTYLQEVGGFTDQELEKIIYLGEDKERSGWQASFLRWRVKDLVQWPPEGDYNEKSRQYISGYQISLTAGGADAEVCFDQWVLRKKGALKGRYWYRTVLEDDEGYYSAPSDVSNVIDCDGSDAIVTQIYDASSDTRIRNKVMLRLGGDRPDVWTKVRDLSPELESFVDETPDEEAAAFQEEFYYAPPKAHIMEVIGNYAWYLNVTDRWKRRKPSRGYKARAFAPFQVGDYDCFDIRPEDGQELTGIKPYMGLLVVTKDHSIWTMSEGLDEVPILRVEEAGIIAPRTLLATSYGIIGLSHQGVIKGNIATWDLAFGRPIYGAMESVSTATLEQAVGFYRNDHYFIFFGNPNNIGFVCYLPTGQWTQLSNITCQAALLLEASGEGNKILYGDHQGYVNYMLQGDDDFGVAIASEANMMNFITDSLDRDQFLRRVAFLAKKLAGSPTITITPYKDEIAGSALEANSITTTTFALHEQGFPQGLEGNILSTKLTGSARFALSDAQLDIWKRPERK